MVAEGAAGCGTTVAGATFVAGVLVGLPHGAADHVLPAWWAGRRPDRRGLLRVGSVYAAGAAAAVVALLVAPAAALVVALAASAWHFGADDAAEAGLRGAGAREALVAAGYGLAPVLGPLAWWPRRAGHLLGWLVPGLAWGSGAAHLAAAAVVAAAVAAVAAAGRGRRAAVAAEVGIVVATGAALPPLAAFGLYFALWHAPRHVARVAAMDPTCGPGDARPGSAPPRPASPGPPSPGSVAALARAAWPAAAAAYAGVALAWVVVPATDRAPAVLLGLLAVAVPHAVIVARNRPWRSPAGPAPAVGAPAPGSAGCPVARVAACPGPTAAGDRPAPGPAGGRTEPSRSR